MSNNIVSGPSTQIKTGTTAEWASADPILDEGEPGYDYEANLFKVGTGTDRWSTLSSASWADVIDFISNHDN